MEIRVLGPFALLDGERLLTLGGPKPQALLAILLLARGRPVAPSRLIDELWGDAPPRTALNTLQAHVAALRRVMGSRLRTESGGYAFELGTDELDSTRFEALLTAGRAASHTDAVRAAELLGQALDCWRGPSLAGLPLGPMLEAESARLDELRLVALEEHAEAVLRLGGHEALVVDLIGHAHTHRTRERLTSQLMLALHRSGRSADALVVAGNLRDALDAELGVDPGDDFTAVEHAIRRDDPALLAPTADGLPIAGTRFIGRAAELRDVISVLGTSRLLTLVGAGGSGKTRLAIEAARQSAANHPDGVHLIALAAVPQTGSVTRELAAALGVRERRGRGLAEIAVQRLHDRRVLLVFDNCEHLVAPCAALIARLLAGCPGVRILATSREPLQVEGETVRDVSGLAVPEMGASPEAVSSADAVRLLLERAGRHGRHVSGSDTDMDLAASICRSVDGLPLALELAAARLRTLSLGELAAGLDHRLRLLRGDAREVAPRHLSMRAAIDWSHDLLDPPEQMALRRLSVCAGMVIRDGAEAVIGDVDAPVDDVLLHLVNKSMVTVSIDPSGTTRYGMLQTVREYGLERLVAAGEEGTIRERHACWYAMRVGQPGDWNGGQGAWLDRLDVEHPDIRVALGWYLGGGWAPERALELAGSVWLYWYMRGLLGEGRRWLGLALASATEPTAIRARAARAAAALARSAGDVEDAQRQGEISLGLYRALEDTDGIAAALNSLSITAQSLGDFSRAKEAGLESLAVVRTTANHVGVAASLNNLAAVCRCLGEFDEAMGYLVEALQGFQDASDLRGEAAALCNLALVEVRRGDFTAARERGLDSLEAFHRLRFAEGEVDALELLACVDVGEGAARSALRILTVAHRERGVLGALSLAPDEVELHAAAAASAHEALDASVRAAIVDAAAATTREALVAELLAARARPQPA